MAVRAEIAPGTLVEGGERIMVEASPNLGLPAAVEVFDGGLEPAFPRRREHGRDVEAQAGPHHATNRISMLMRPLEDRVVVELSVGRPPELSPVRHQRRHRGFRGHQRLRPGAGPAAKQRNDIEDLDAEPAHEKQARRTQPQNRP